MAGRTSKKEMARAGVAALPAGLVDEAAYGRLRAALPQVSERTLRTALRESGRPLAPVVEGVRQDSFDNLRRTLTALSSEYEAAAAARRKMLRALVITAKNHADLSARSARKRAEKQEMALWIRSWLLNPGVFPEWAELRKRRRGGEDTGE